LFIITKKNLTLTQISTLNQTDFADKGFIIKTLFLRAFLVYNYKSYQTCQLYDLY